MPYVVELPQVGESVTEGIISRWLKRPGDQVERYEPLVEVVTDKVTMEVPSPVRGKLVRLIVQEGETVPMGAPIAEMEAADGASPPPSGPRQPAGAAQPAAPTHGNRPRYATEFLKEVRPVGPTGGDTAYDAPETDGPGAAPGAARYSPVVLKLAQEHGVDLAQLKGTGLGGRVTKQDVLRYLEQRGSAPQPAPAAPAAPVPQAPAADEEVLALSPVRRLIAENMVRSAREVPHAWSAVEVDVTALARYREAIKDEFARREGVPLTYLPFAIKAVTDALREQPVFNAAWDNGRVVLKRRINIGVAVAAPQGLVVPVVHDADRLSIAGLARAVADLAARARENRLRLEDVQGGTFTVNNTGALGSVVSQAIIHPGQAGIATVEAVQRRAVPLDDSTIAVRHIMVVTLSFDHRIADGLEAGRFLQAVKGRLEAMGPDTPLY